jgi:type II secretory pathway pseudopilin PulG
MQKNRNSGIIKITMKILRKNKKSFTLVEVMVTVAILIVALSILLVSLVQIGILNKIINNRTIAITHAQYVLEDIKNAVATESFSNITTGFSNSRWDLTSTAITTRGLVPLNNETIVTSSINGTNYKNITVTTNWDERRGTAVSGHSNITLETIITNPNP